MSAAIVGSQDLHAQNVAASVEGLCRGSSITLLRLLVGLWCSLLLQILNILHLFSLKFFFVWYDKDGT